MPETATMAIDQKVFFLCANRPFTLGDVLDAALFRGELMPAWHDLLRLIAAERQATERKLEYADEAIDAAAEQFRYDHDLITAEETERWLGERGLSLGDFGAFFVRHYWGREFEAIEAEMQDYLTAPDEIRELLIAELILSGELARMGERLAWRAAAAREISRPIDAQMIFAEKTIFLERSELCGEPNDWLAKIGRDESWLDEMLTLEGAFRQEVAAVVSTPACAKELVSLRLPLTGFEIETIELDSMDAAREAFLCAREDGISMEQVAAQSRYPFRRSRVFLERIPEQLQPKFLRAQQGEILEPIAVGDSYHVCRILDKNEPELSDAGVRERVERQILDRRCADLMTRHIQWRLLLS